MTNRLLLLILLPALGAIGATTNVASIGALQSALNNAAPGDVIVLADGTYLNAALTIGNNNITVKSATPGGVYLNEAQSIDIAGDSNTFTGFQFTSRTATNGVIITVSGSHNRLTQLNFSGYSAQKYINLQGQYDEVAYCNFENKPTTAQIGNLIHIAPDPILPGYHTIRYCSFKNMPGAGGDNGNECIRISNGATSDYISRTTVEYCYFNNTGDGDSEVISVKCRENLIRYCTFTNNQDGMLVFRNGNDNVAYGNFFLSAGGIRVKEANNIYCYNNYFQNSGVGGSMNAVTYVFLSPNLKNINFFHNTFVECGMIDLDTGATSNTWANNIFKKSSGSIFTGSASGISWAGNIYTNTLGISIPSGMTKANPQLVLNAAGYFGLNSNSPAIDASSTNYPAILDIANVDDDASLLLDISGQTRPVSKLLKDVGCDEFGTNGTLNRPLALSDVGPSYLGGPSGAVAPSIAPQPQSQTVIAGAPVSFWIGATGTAPLIYQWRKDGTNIAGATGATNTIAAAQSTSAGNYTVVVTNVAGSVTSAVATLTVNISPAIDTEPQSQSVNAGSPASFWVSATGTAPLAYQWRKDGTNIAGATAATNTIGAAQSTNAGNYTVVVTNVAGSITSAVATLTVNISPAIDTEPQSQNVNAGSPASFWVNATGTAPVAYQWRKDGTNLVGVTGATNTLIAAQSGNVGSYDVVVTNVAGSVTSAVATLTVVIASPQITGIAHDGGGSFTLSGTGPVGEPYRILAATNVVLPVASWLPVQTNIFTGGVFNFTDQQITNFPQRFYRVTTP